VTVEGTDEGTGMMAGHRQHFDANTLSTFLCLIFQTIHPRNKKSEPQ
jgi:hypothetical protein